MKIIVVLPAFNEEGNLDALIADLVAALAAWQHRIIVVDDGSSDGTLAIAERWAVRGQVEIVRHVKNQGLGATMRDGLLAAHAHVGPGDVVVTMDADGSHRPEQIPEMVARLTDAGVCIASRYQEGSVTRGVPAYRQVLSLGARQVGERVLGLRGVRDYTCGYRAIRGDVLRRAVERWGPRIITETGFAATLELLLRLSKLEPGFAEIPMILRYDQKQGASKMRIMRTVDRTLRVVGRHLRER